MLKKIECPEGEMKEYVGCKMVCNQTERSLKLSQLVLIQSFKNELEKPLDHCSVISAIPGSILIKCDPKEQVNIRMRTEILLRHKEYSAL